ncbi:sigma E protease regulator RseP [Alteromonas sediminis]|uniref:Zinc metalloprotease n=1 Tax=Alteromonas sediminis TaxID=2259342 RepID=A0A3N5Y4C4_9ALTE|nr:sigma E protease regulator RseP [Alteromonas sediminis]RPJ68370.1 sigma E protease regulator RseP [Alteromonas sediminis]
MFSFFWSLGAFIVALGILVAVHEWGHFYVARRCGVFVKRFSVGFGKPIWSKVSKSGTEYVIAAIPLGGYVSMLDERVDEVPEHQRSQAFNNKPVLQRMAIIFAGPGINFVFAALALYVMYLIGVQTVRPVIGNIEPASIAAQANMPAGAEITQVNGRKTLDWEAINFELISAIGNERLQITLDDNRTYTLDLQRWAFDPEKSSPIRSLGIEPYRPAITNRIAVVSDNSPAKRAGFSEGDILIALNDDKIARWQDWVEAFSSMPGATVNVLVNRDGNGVVIPVTLDSVETETGLRGFLGVVPTAEPWPEDMVFVHQYGVVDAAVKGIERTWRLMVLSVEMIGKLITGDVSVKNLSGPISIAQGAGTSAGYGLVYFLSFLALISVNLGIINLLPLPMLDGGHLMYFIVEWVRGKPVSEHVQEIGFRIGGVLLFTLMGIALFNDIARLS